MLLRCLVVTEILLYRAVKDFFLFKFDFKQC